jgi:acetate kinase
VRVLVVNTGSSSLKLSVLSEDGTVHAATTVQRWTGSSHVEPIHRFLDSTERVDAVGHRVVHGGPRFREPARVDPELLDYLESIHDLAPLHNPRAVTAIRVVTDLLPQTPAVACFDTAFHATLPAAAYTYALPREWNARWGLRRYGFHGLSHAYAVRRGVELAGIPMRASRIVSCHLGAGASLAAIRDGMCRHHHGLHSARRSGDGHPLR